VPDNANAGAVRATPAGVASTVPFLLAVTAEQIGLVAPGADRGDRRGREAMLDPADGRRDVVILTQRRVALTTVQIIVQLSV
jgi:hypothetical protein